VPGTWAIHLDSWIIQDGNYDDFSRGQDAAFAVEFYPDELIVVSIGDRTASHLGGGRYHVEGEVAFASQGAWVLDCGVRIYKQVPPPAGVVHGMSVRGEVVLGVDPFFYFEELAKLPDMPPLIYRWRIERIARDMAPWIEVASRTFERDPSRPGWKDVEATDAWNDDGGSAGYLLHARLLDPRPDRHLAMPG
jgi:hypothetical protein